MCFPTTKNMSGSMVRSPAAITVRRFADTAFPNVDEHSCICVTVKAGEERSHALVRLIPPVPQKRDCDTTA